MDPLKLYIANKNYSSWSLRAWLTLSTTGAPFEETIIPLDQPTTREAIGRISPSGRVPALQHGELVIWESLAICEYLAEAFPMARLWPESRSARAVARSVSHEMHAGFPDLRREMPMNIRANMPGRGRTDASLRDIARVMAIWRNCRERFGQGGPFLFGHFSIADAMYAPVVARFRTYAVELGAVERDYSDAVWNYAPMRLWVAAARAESWIVPSDELPPMPV
jgi:glutathione S-transferase